MARPAKIAGGAVLGIVGGAAVAVALAVGAANLFEISEAEGAYAMQVAFFYAPAGAVIGAIAGIVWGASR